jgi:hypothetical protein
MCLSCSRTLSCVVSSAAPFRNPSRAEPQKIHSPVLCSTIADSWITQYQQPVRYVGKAVAITDVFEHMGDLMLPAPSTLRYVFWLRNVIHCAKGTVLPQVQWFKPDTVSPNTSYHEKMQESRDRFLSSKSHLALNSLLGDTPEAFQGPMQNSYDRRTSGVESTVGRHSK